MKNKNIFLYLTTILCLLPMILSAVVYDKLPNQVAIHFDSAGNPNNYAPKIVAAFGLPLFMAVINVIVHVTMDNDPKKANVSLAMKQITKWSVPVLSVIIIPCTLFYAMGADIKISVIVPALVGILLVIVGNYLPKCKHNYTVGIKLPWTLSSEENWNKTHHLAGYLWICGGILMIIIGCLNIYLWPLLMLIFLFIFVIPTVYSFLLYKKGV